MTPEPLDPCPVCGSSVYTVGASGRSAECAGHIGHSYSARLDDHRRLCAEVALARLVMEHAFEIMEILNASDFSGTDECDIRNAIARVREASK